MQLLPESIMHHPLVQGAYYNFYTNTYYVSLWSIFTVFSTVAVYVTIYGGYELTIYIFYWMSQGEIDAEEEAWKAKQQENKETDDKKTEDGDKAEDGDKTEALD